MIFDLFQLIGGAILAFGWIPQILQIIRTKSVKDLNKRTFWSLFVGISLMEIYGIKLAADGVGYAFLITNSLSLLLIVIILGFIVKYRQKQGD